MTKYTIDLAPEERTDLMEALAMARAHLNANLALPSLTENMAHALREAEARYLRMAQRLSDLEAHEEY
jgi:hypothetical protein